MDQTAFLEQPALQIAWFICLIAIIAVWDTIWKLIALWKCGRRNQLGWFVAIGILNTVGILPIIYLLVYRDKKSD